jgi:hypothetical protein
MDGLWRPADFALPATVWKIHLRLSAWLGKSVFAVPAAVLTALPGWMGVPPALYAVVAVVLSVALSWPDLQMLKPGAYGLLMRSP